MNEMKTGGRSSHQVYIGVRKKPSVLRPPVRLPHPGILDQGVEIQQEVPRHEWGTDITQYMLSGLYSFPTTPANLVQLYREHDKLCKQARIFSSSLVLLR